MLIIRILQALVFANKELVWLLCNIVFFLSFLIGMWLTLAMLAGANQASAGPVFHTKAWRWRCRGPGGCVVDWLGNFWYSRLLFWLILLSQLVFFFFFKCGVVFPCFSPMMKFLEVLDCQWPQFWHITLQIHILWLIIKRLFIWKRIMAVYVHQNQLTPSHSLLGQRYTHKFPFSSLIKC